MSEQNNNQNCCDNDDKQGCCGSTDGGKCFNWQKAIFIVVVIAACAVAGHSYLSNGSGGCPITGACAEATPVDGCGDKACSSGTTACDKADVCEKKAACDKESACADCPKEGGTCDKQATCDKAAACDKKAACDKEAAVTAACPMGGAAGEKSEAVATGGCPSSQTSTDAGAACSMSATEAK